MRKEAYAEKLEAKCEGKIRSVFYVKPHSYVSEFEYICVDFKCK